MKIFPNTLTVSRNNFVTEIVILVFYTRLVGMGNGIEDSCIGSHGNSTFWSNSQYNLKFIQFFYEALKLIPEQTLNKNKEKCVMRELNNKLQIALDDFILSRGTVNRIQA